MCGFCKEHRFNAKYWTQEEKDKKIIEWSNHITWASNERVYYRYIFIFIEFITFRDCIKNSKEAFKNLTQDINPIKLANSLDIKVHISWDFAEQVYITYSTQQVVYIILFFINTYIIL